ncbi:hypothetical protein JCM18899A_38520 [Nocardioides sp. AN3]
MPTARPRYAITETDQIHEALRVAAEQWPEDKENPRVLLLHLVETGLVALRREGRIPDPRRQAVLETAGAFGDLYPGGYLDDLRQDWPE